MTIIGDNKPLIAGIVLIIIVISILVVGGFYLVDWLL